VSHDRVPESVFVDALLLRRFYRATLMRHICIAPAVYAMDGICPLESVVLSERTNGSSRLLASYRLSSKNSLFFVFQVVAVIVIVPVGRV